MSNVVAAGGTVASGSPPPAPYSLFDYLGVLGGLSLPITAVLILIGLAMVACRLVEVDCSLGKFTLKIHRPRKTSDQQMSPAALEGVAENIPAIPVVPKSMEVQAAPAESDEPREEEKAATGHPWEYIKARTVDALDENWPQWRESISAEQLEFWETDHLRRRANYGADHGREAVRQLAIDHPTWAYPHAVLLDWSREERDFEAAERHLAAGLTRQNSPQIGDVLSSGVKLRFQTGGSRSGVEFCFEWMKASVPERVKALLFTTLADLLKDSGDVEGYRIAYEWALLLHSANRSRAFPLAYSYAEDTSHWLAAMSTYVWTIAGEDYGPVSRNNLAILLGPLDKAAQIESYEKAVAEGDKFAVANLAGLLINDGYIAAGERLLATVVEQDAAAELHTSTALAAHAARRKLEAKQKEISNLIESQIDPFRAAIARSFRHLQSGAVCAAGYYVSSDKLTQVFVSINEVTCRMRIGLANYTGTLRWQAGCYAGPIGWEGGGLLSRSIDATLFDEGEGTVRLFLWPASIATDVTLDIRELSHCDSEPPPLPPPAPPPPQSQSALGSLLLSTDGARTS